MGRERGMSYLCYILTDPMHESKILERSDPEEQKRILFKSEMSKLRDF